MFNFANSYSYIYKSERWTLINWFYLNENLQFCCIKVNVKFLIYTGLRKLLMSVIYCLQYKKPRLFVSTNLVMKKTYISFLTFKVWIMLYCQNLTVKNYFTLKAYTDYNINLILYKPLNLVCVFIKCDVTR